MLLPGALFALFATGFWLYCLTDAIMTPAAECRGLPKAAWIAIIGLAFIGGAIAWLIVRPSIRRSYAPPLTSAPEEEPAGPDADSYFPGERWTAADDAVARHPAGRARTADTTHATPRGPDDDLDFLRALDRAIRGNSQAGEEV